MIPPGLFRQVKTGIAECVALTNGLESHAAMTRR